MLHNNQINYNKLQITNNESAITINKLPITIDSRIFIAGGTGLVGSAIIRKLIEKGYKNIIANYYSKQPTELFAHSLTNSPLTNYQLQVTNNQPPITFLKLDLTDQKAVDEFFDRYRPDYVFLAAAKVGGILANNTYKADFIYDNLIIAANVISSSYKYGVKKLLNLGSSCIYPKFCPQPMKEEYLLSGELEPTNEPYAIAKISAIKLCRYFNEQYNTNFISAMPTNLYGTNDNYNLETSHVLPALIRKFHLAKLLSENRFDEILDDIRKIKIGFDFDSKIDILDKNSIIEMLSELGITKGYVTLWGTGEVYREFLHVDDLAEACVFLMENIEAQRMKEISSDYFVNVGCGEDIKLKDLAFLVREIVGFKGEIIFDHSKPDGTPKKLLDISKLRELGWGPKISLKDGIRHVYDEYCKR